VSRRHSSLNRCGEPTLSDGARWIRWLLPVCVVAVSFLPRLAVRRAIKQVRGRFGQHSFFDDTLASATGDGEYELCTDRGGIGGLVFRGSLAEVGAEFIAADVPDS